MVSGSRYQKPLKIGGYIGENKRKSQKISNENRSICDVFLEKLSLNRF
jgi:hypothetical protein